jgi:uncharacterized membrane protein
MNRPVRWYLLLSTWIFIISALYPLHKISTFPLNLIAIIGCFDVIYTPFKENYLKNLYILFIHLAPFLWIPYDISYIPIVFAIFVIIAYLIFIFTINTHPFEVYSKLHNEKHTELEDFLSERFGISI